MPKNTDEKRIEYIRSQRKDSVVLATELMNELPYLVRSDDNLYIYNGKCYDMINDDFLRTEYSKFVVKYGITDRWKGGVISDVTNFIKSFSGISRVEMNSKPNLLCLNNGVLDIETEEFFDHSPSFYFDTFIDVVYDTNETDCKVFTDYLTHVSRGESDTIENIIRLGGYLLDYSTDNMRKCNKMFLFDGQGGSGKSTLIDTYSLFFSDKQITAIDLDEMSKQDMEKEDLIKSRVNFSTEQKRSYLDAENIKKIISGERLKIKRKFNQPITFKPKTKIIVACNGLPKFSDTSEGIYRRLIIFKFKNQYKNKAEYEKMETPEQFNIYLQDRSLFSKIEKEKSAIFNLFLGGLKRLKADDFIFIEGNEYNRIIEEFKSDNDVAREFLKEKYMVDTNSETTIMDIFNGFKMWYQSNVGGYSFKFRSNEMGRRIREIFNIESNGRKRFVVDGEVTFLTTYPIRKITYENEQNDTAEYSSPEARRLWNE